MGTGLAVEGLSKTFGHDTVAVHEVTFKVDPGQFVVLLGRSGCGKTTTLRCIAGFERPDRGRIWLGEQIVDDADGGVHVPTERRTLGMVFQSYAIWPHMTVGENVTFPLQVRRVPRSESAQRVRQALDLVGLRGLEDRPASRLSGGQQQRVALARALVYAPRVLLLDEPLSNLDAELRARLRFELKEIQRRTGVTAVYVTHDQSEAVVLGDQVGVMDAGRLVQFCSPAELYMRPANTFVAAFTGVGNILKAAVDEVTGDEVISRTEGGLIVRSCRAADVGRKRDVWVAFRPENTALCAGPSGAEPNAWTGLIRRADFLGVQTRYSVAIDNAEVLAVRTGSIQEFSVGDQVVVTVPPAAVSVLTE